MDIMQSQRWSSLMLVYFSQRHLNNFQDVKILYLSKQNDK